jgi:hypothetical protein
MEFSGLRLQSRTAFVIFAFLCCSAVRNVSAQQAKPILAGTWKLNLSKSRLAPQHPRESDIYKIRQSEPRLEVIHIFSGRSETYSYVTDGKERVANRSVQDGELRAKAYWDGDTLVIDKQQGSAWTSRYSLSHDGKSLIVTQHITRSAFSAPFDEFLTYDKQQ